jgi:hypothetical protein
VRWQSQRAKQTCSALAIYFTLISHRGFRSDVGVGSNPEALSLLLPRESLNSLSEIVLKLLPPFVLKWTGRRTKYFVVFLK